MALNTGLDWLLDDLTGRISSVRHAMVLSTDGLVTANSQSMEKPDAEHLAAVASGLQSLAKGSGAHFGSGDVRQTMIEFEQGLLFVRSAGEGSCLCVLTGEEVDIGAVAYEMELLVTRVGEHLKLSARNGT